MSQTDTRREARGAPQGTVWLIEEFGRGGIARYANDVAEMVPGRVVVATVRGCEGGRGAHRHEGWFPRHGGRRVHRVLSAGVGLLTAAVRVRRGDIAWVPLGVLPAFELVLCMVLRLAGAHLVVTVHNRAPHSSDRDEHPLVVRAGRLARRVVVHTEAMRQWAEERGLPVVELPFPVGAQGTRRRPVDGARVLVVGAGSNEPYKGFDVLVEALAVAHERQPGLAVDVLIAGRHVKGEQLDLLAVERGVDKHVRWCPGFLPEQAFHDLLAEADVVALPYRHVDHSGVAAFTVAHRRPALASDLPGLRQQLGAAALFSPAGDAVALADLLVALPVQLADLRAAATQVDSRPPLEAYGDLLVQVCEARPYPALSTAGWSVRRGSSSRS